MQICHVYETASFESGGVVRYIYDQGRGIARRGHEVDVLTCDSASRVGQLAKAWGGQVRIHGFARMGVLGFIRNRKVDPALAECIEKCSVVHIHGVWSIEAMIVARYAHSLNIPFVITLHGMLDDWCMGQRAFKKRVFMNLISNKMLARADVIIASTTREREQALRWLPCAEIEVLAPVMDLEPFLSLPTHELAEQRFFENTESDQSVVLFLSRIHEKKGVEVLIHAMKLLEQDSVQCTAIIAGVGDERYVQGLKNLVSELGLGDVVRFIGMIDGDLKASVYSKADLFVLPTAQENFGLVFTESMACGTPVLTTNGIDIHQELEASGGAVLCDRTPRAFADSMVQLLGDKARLTEMGNSGRSWVFEEFSAERVLDKHEALYQRVADQCT